MTTTERQFRVDFDRAGPTLTVYLSGELDIMVIGLAEAIIEHCDPPTDRIVLDATDLSFCDSTGLAQMVAVRLHAAEIDAELSVYRPHRVVASAIRAAGLGEALPVRMPQED
jgi:anti-anti-sigma factor